MSRLVNGQLLFSNKVSSAYNITPHEFRYRHASIKWQHQRTSKNALKHTNVNRKHALTSCFHVLSSSAKVVKSLGAQKYLHSGLGPSGELLICSMSLLTSPRIKGSIKYTGILWLDINPRNFLTTCCLTEDRKTIFALKLFDRKTPQSTETRKSYLPNTSSECTLHSHK